MHPLTLRLHSGKLLVAVRSHNTQIRQLGNACVSSSNMQQPRPAHALLFSVQVVEDNKQLLKAKYDQAKALGASVNASKARINELRGQIEQWRMQRSAACKYGG